MLDIVEDVIVLEYFTDSGALFKKLCKQILAGPTSDSVEAFAITIFWMAYMMIGSSTLCQGILQNVKLLWLDWWAAWVVVSGG